MGTPQVAAQEPGLARDSGPNRIRVEDGGSAGAHGARGACSADPAHAGALRNAIHSGVPHRRGATGDTLGGPVVRASGAQDRSADRARSVAPPVAARVERVENRRRTTPAATTSAPTA